MKNAVIIIITAAIILMGAVAVFADDSTDGIRFDADGEIRYYEGGQPVYAGVVEFAGAHYYINSAKRAVKGRIYDIGEGKTNGLVPAGRYFIDEKGLISPLEGLYRDADGNTRYYVNGSPAAAGLVWGADGYAYYINSAGVAVCGREYYCSRDNGIGINHLLFDTDGRGYVFAVGDGTAYYVVKDEGELGWTVRLGVMA